MKDPGELWEDAVEEVKDNPDKVPTLAVTTGTELLTRVSDLSFFKYITPFGGDKLFHLGAAHSGVRTMNKIKEELPDQTVKHTFSRIDPVSNLSCYAALKTRDPSFRRKTAVSGSIVMAGLFYKETLDAFISKYDMAGNTIGVMTGTGYDYISEEYGDGSFKQGIKAYLSEEEIPYSAETSEMD